MARKIISGSGGEVPRAAGRRAARWRLKTWDRVSKCIIHGVEELLL
jgi:hypothetical protein